MGKQHPSILERAVRRDDCRDAIVLARAGLRRTQVRLARLFHEVQPAAKALQCLECHRESGRMDWQALGYKKDPLLKAMK